MLTGGGARTAYQAGVLHALASCLLFEPCFVQALMALGEHDACAHKDALLAFFGRTPA